MKKLIIFLFVTMLSLQGMTQIYKIKMLESMEALYNMRDTLRKDSTISFENFTYDFNGLNDQEKDSVIKLISMGEILEKIQINGKSYQWGMGLETFDEEDMVENKPHVLLDTIYIYIRDKCDIISSVNGVPDTHTTEFNMIFSPKYHHLKYYDQR